MDMKNLKPKKIENLEIFKYNLKKSIFEIKYEHTKK